MCVRNEIDRFHLAIDVIDRVPRLEGISGHLRQELMNMLTDHGRYIREHGEDMPGIHDWQWPVNEVLVLNAGSSSLKFDLFETSREGRRKQTAD